MDHKGILSSAFNMSLGALLLWIIKAVFCAEKKVQVVICI